MLRIFDKLKGRWIKNDIYISTNENMFKIDRTLFKNKEKLVQVSSERYVIHKDIGLVDKNYQLIYEGDIVNAQISEDEFIIVEIAYVNQTASYMAFDFKTDTAYSITEEGCKFMEVVGNVFDTPELLEVTEDKAKESEE